MRHNKTLPPSPDEDHADAACIVPHGAPGHPLTSREAEVIALVCEGKSNKEIARALYISLDTAKAHLTSIMHKLGARNRTEAALAWKEMHGPTTPTLDREAS
ncbi:MAG TPA: response regulator transcription factor [Chloroflexia bacterium]|nr:response regulator transcription factor [Chloroflexia bacterium]